VRTLRNIVTLPGNRAEEFSDPGSIEDALIHPDGRIVETRRESFQDSFDQIFGCLVIRQRDRIEQIGTIA
jgi:hypothetical protein